MMWIATHLNKFDRFLEERLNVGLLLWWRMGSVVLAFAATVFLTSAYVAGSYLETGPLLIAVIALVHLRYLWLVNELNLLDVPLEEVTRYEALLPILLAISYIVYALSEIPESIRIGSLLSMVATGFMASVHLLWLRNDFRRWQSTDETRKRPDYLGWTALDFLFAVTLFVALVVQIDEYPNEADWGKRAKDWLVLGCLTYVAISSVFRKYGNNAYYHYAYCNFLKHIGPSRVRCQPAAVGNGIADWLPKGELRVLDFGCANGQRGLDVLRAAGIPLESVALYVGVDRISYWKEDFEEQLAATSMEHKFIGAYELKKRAASDNESFDVIIMSHVFYTGNPFLRRGRNRVARLLCRGGVIFVRGYARSSVFWAAARDSARDLLQSNSDVFWVQRYLLPWMRRNGLLLYGQPTSARPIAYLQVNYPSSRAAELLRVIDLCYGSRVKEGTRQAIYDRTARLNQFIPLDDMLFALVKA